jgi:aminopeptidase
MTDPRIDNLANTLVNYSIGVQPGEWIIVQGSVVAMPLVEAVMAHILRAGGHPTLRLTADRLQEIMLREANDDQLQFVDPTFEASVDHVAGFIGLNAPSNTRVLTGSDPNKMRMQQLSRRDVMKRFRARTLSGDLRWVGTQFPCNALAQEADMSLTEFEDFVYKATYADQPDAIACWNQVHDEQQRLVDWLAGKKDIQVRGPNVDLTLSIEGRGFINSDGKKNMPSGEIFTSPVEDSVNGWVRFTYPAIRGGREVEGVEMKFEAGKVIEASARKNESFLHSQLDADAGSRYLGEFAIGTNYGIQRFTKSILYDEKIGGTIHMAIGSGFPEIGGKNESVVHWDFICDMREDSEILVDGDLFYKNGQFQV